MLFQWLTQWRRQALLSYKGLFLWLNWPGYIGNIVLRPVLLVVMFGLTGRFARGEDSVEAFVIGMTVYGVPNIVMGGVIQGFYYERSFGTLHMLFASSGSRIQNYLCRGILHYPNSILSIISSLIGAWIILDITFDDANWFPVWIAFLLITASTVLFALFLGNFAIAVRDWQAPYGVTQIAFLALCGAVIPRDSLGPVLHDLGGLLPMTHGLEAARAAFAGASLSAISDQLLLEALVGLVYGVIGFLLFRLVEAYARRTGSYEFA